MDMLDSLIVFCSVKIRLALVKADLILNSSQISIHCLFPLQKLSISTSTSSQPPLTLSCPQHQMISKTRN
ncbi:hypothetical protein BLNAU_25186 [Blattamonas nauphoetae]|uniref:Uncharacterized protein n=1 Tax=Blattamonas nauphoetae TaxID=2049346 RepID=A0ABQ9WL52_9EUKA|nr:hypothetical protein BLNAU_25186 [Blattamonas nauphoetae]